MFVKWLTRLRRPSINNPEQSVDQEFLSQEFREEKFPELFDFLKSYFLENKEKFNKKTVYPCGEDSDEMYGEAYSYKDFYYDIHYLFDTARGVLDHRFATREKIYIEKDFFDFFKEEATDSSELALLRKLYDFAEREADNYELGKKIKDANVETKDQLMLIKYSVSDTLESWQRKYFHSLASLRFGVAHEDETYFSVHLGETHPELYCWDQEKLDWVKSSSDERVMAFLCGEYSLDFQYTPTVHQLIPEGIRKDDARYSYIMERTHKNDLSDKLSFEVDAEFASLDLHLVREERTAFVIYHKYPAHDLDEEIVDLTRKFIQVHLHFFREGIKEGVHVLGDDPDMFLNLEKRGFNKVVLFPAGIFIQDEKCINMLLLNACKMSRMYALTYPKHLRSMSGLSILNLDKGRGEVFDKTFKERGVESTLNWLPNYLITLEEEKKGCDSLHELTRYNPTKEAIEEWGSKIENHLEQGFKRVFIFNTEFYSDIDRSKNPFEYETVVGLSSGFKLNYLAEKTKDTVKNIIYLDINENSINFKKKMLKEWDGRDLPTWVRVNFIESEKHKIEFFEKNFDFLIESWNREIANWGGEEQFVAHWNWFRNLKIEFHKIDFLSETKHLLELVPTEKTAFWISNVWDNEYVSYYYGNNLKEKYFDWLRLFENRHNDVAFFQSLPLFAHRLDPHDGLTVKQMLKKYGENTQ